MGGKVKVGRRSYDKRSKKVKFRNIIHTRFYKRFHFGKGITWKKNRRRAQIERWTVNKA